MEIFQNLWKIELLVFVAKLFHITWKICITTKLCMGFKNFLHQNKRMLLIIFFHEIFEISVK